MTPGNILNSSRYFWWAAPIIFVFKYFWWIFAMLIVFYIPILSAWWWLFFPLVLLYPLTTIYFHWVRWDVWYPSNEWIILELIPPEEVEKPFKAMEDVLSLLWSIIDAPNWREQWCEGMLSLGGGIWFSLEIVSLGGQIHFYARMPGKFRPTFETAFYSHYPDLEIKEVEDYVKKTPKNIPNEKYKVLGEDFCFKNPHCFPIKTYLEFFEEKAETLTKVEEKRIDPMNSLLETLAKVGPYEQVWIQIVCIPILNTMLPWIDEGKESVAKFARRDIGKKESVIMGELRKATEPPKTVYLEPGGGAKSMPPSKTEAGEVEMILTPRERKILTLIEDKMSKLAYQTSIRTIYIAEQDKPHNEGYMKALRTYANHFSGIDLNSLIFFQPTRAKIQYILREKRLYLRERKLFRNYINRFPPFHPEMTAGLGTPILNIEELTTIYHLPIKTIVPTAPKILAKPGSPPPGLPTEE